MTWVRPSVLMVLSTFVLVAPCGAQRSVLANGDARIRADRSTIPPVQPATRSDSLNDAFLSATLSSQAEDTVQTQAFDLKVDDKVRSRASLDEELLVFELGSDTFEIPLDRLRSVYYADAPGRRQRLVVSYESAPDFTTRLILSVSRGDEGTAALLAALRALRLDTEIEEKTPQEMRRLLEGPNLKAYLPYPIALLVTALVAFLFIPSFIHGFDSGHMTVEVNELAAPGFTPSTRNLTVRGRPLPDKAMAHTWVIRGVRNVETYFPVVSADWQPDDPVAVFGKIKELDASIYAALADAREITGVLRNVWWEGMMGRDKRFFRDQMGFTVPDVTLVIDYNANRRFGMYFGIPVVLLVAAFSFLIARASHLDMIAR